MILSYGLVRDAGTMFRLLRVNLELSQCSPVNFSPVIVARKPQLANHSWVLVIGIPEKSLMTRLTFVIHSIGTVSSTSSLSRLYSVGALAPLACLQLLRPCLNPRLRISL